MTLRERVDTGILKLAVCLGNLFGRDKTEYEMNALKSW
jgi:hypothetical protein